MDKPVFVYVTYIATTPEKLWQALTQPEFTKLYWGTTIKSDWKVGSRVESWLPDGRLGDSGVVLEYDPPRRLSYSWHIEFVAEMSKESPSRATFELEPLGDVVKLTLTHDQFEPDSRVYPAISQGWPSVFASLKSLLETGKALSNSGEEALREALKTKFNKYK